MSTKSEESRELKSLRAQVRRLEAANEEIEHLRNAFDALVVAHATSKSQRQEIASTLRNQLRDSHHQAESKAGQLEDARNVVKALAQCSRGEGLRQLEQHLWDAKLAKEMETSKCSNLERRLGEKEIGLGLVWKALQDSEHQREELTEALSQSQKELHSQRASQQQDWDMFKKERKTWYAATQERTQESQMALKHLRDELTFTKDRLKTSEQFSSVNELYLLGQMQATQADLHFVQLELQQARSTISNIEGKNTSLKSELKQEKSDKATTQASLEASQTEVHRLTSELDAEKSQRTQDWESMQQRIDAVDQQRQTQVQRAVKAEEALGKAQKEMVLIRAKEQDLEEQVESATEQLAELDGLRVAHAELSTQLTEMAARNTLAETDSAALSELNAQLLGHSNPNQKIVQVAKIRQELAELKKKYAMAIAGLEAAKQENRELNEELDSLRIASPQNHGGPRSVSPTKNQQYETLGRGAGGMKIRRPPPSTSRVLSDATNASSRRTSSSSTLGSRASSGQHGRASQSSTAATSLSSSSAKVSLANVASASKFKAFMR